MANFNKVLLMGNLTKDPELRYTPQGTAVVNLRMAVNRRWKDKTGESKEEVCFITVVAWDKQAEVCNQYLRKGAPVFVEGRLQSRSWEDATGGKRSVVEVRAERVQFLSSSQGASGAREQSQPDADVISEVSPQQVDSDSLQEDNIS
ncbi:MAG TPA: single-stranded DNA-binding protein [Candidatus Omnitrophica bacterium]|nr:single-stranded DNA-binding protein [Candidatus Omnitrophota bacterium]